MKVRIPAVIAANGKWCAYGYSTEHGPDWSMIEETADNGEMESNYRRIWITVDLPVPTVAEVEASEVSDDR